jgi:hypothetical protein
MFTIISCIISSGVSNPKDAGFPIFKDVIL